MTPAPGEVPPRGPLDRRVLGLAPALGRHLRWCALAAALTAAAVLVQVEVLSRALPRLVDGDASAAGSAVAVLMAVAVARGLMAAGVERSGVTTMRSTRASIRDEVLDRLAIVRLDAVDRLPPAKVLALTDDAVAALEPWVRSYLPALTVAVAVPVAAGIRVAVDDWLSAAVLAVVVPLVPIFMVLVGRVTQARADRQWEALTRLGERFLDTLEGLPTLRLFGRASSQAARVREVTERYRAVTMRTLRVAFLSALVLELLATMSVALVAVSLGIRLTNGDVDLRAALVVLLLAPELFGPLRRVSAAFHAAQAGTDAATEIIEVRDLPLRPVGRSSPPASGSLTLDAVEVIDPDRGVRLRPASITVAPGEIVAVAGPSGSGKSTLLDVARGVLAPDGGTATIGAVPVGDMDPGERAGALRWVPQRPAALGLTVLTSVALGGRNDGVPPDASATAGPVEPAETVARVVPARRVLTSLGLDHLADRDPREVSGGERRRLSLGRALLAAGDGEMRYLLVDEPTAQLDEVNAEKVRQALIEAARDGVGVLVATHDPRLMNAADRCIHLDAGDRRARGPASTSEGSSARAGAGADGNVDPEHRVSPTGRGRTRSIQSAPPELIPTVTSTADHQSEPGALRWLAGLARRERARAGAALALGMAAEACTVGLAGTAAWLVVRAAERPSFTSLAVAAVGVRACGLGKGLFRYGERLASHDVTLRLLADTRSEVVAGLARLAPGGLPSSVGHGDLVRRVVADVDRLQDLPLRVVMPAVSGLGVGVVAVAVSGVLSPAAGAVLALAVGSVGVVAPIAGHRRSRRAERLTAAASGELAGLVLDNAAHTEELVACGADRGSRAEIDAAARRLADAERTRERGDVVTAGLVAAAPALTVAGVIAAVGPSGSTVSGPVLGLLVLLPLAVVEVLTPLAGVGPVLAAVTASAERVRALLGRPDPVPDPDAPVASPARSDLQLRDVALAWPDGPVVVEGIDLGLAEGERLLVTGSSGSGKSTLAATLVRFVTPVAGSITVGGEFVEGLASDDIRSLVTWCPQDPWFSATTLGDNLRIARPEATDDELWDVLTTVRLRPWVEALPDGLDTRLARDATSMSGGERQRLALARALLGGQRTIVFDEPTSHLDVDLAAAVRADLLSATADRAVMLLGHDGPDHHWDGGRIDLDRR